ncbi:Anhydro-N-acetylmuramic acid kinase, partial [Zancudomyces culisetae]
HQVDDDSEVKSTWQNGESSVIVKETGRTVVNDMRVADMVYGGQGAPLTSFLDVVLCAEEGRTRAYQNLGGISNTTFVSMKNGIITAFAFDQGPSNVLIDRAVRHYTGGQQQFDKDGQMASRGKVNTELLQELLQNPYYKKQLPKTTGRELFSDSYADEVIKRCEELNMSPDDVVATITQLTIDTVVQSYHDFMPEPVEEIFVHGGGGFNPVVMEGIRKGLPNTKVTLLTKEEYGLPASCKEAAMFALIGHECIHGRPGQIPSCTGASQYTVLGKITPGSNYHELIRKIAQEPVQSFDRTVKLVIEK